MIAAARALAWISALAFGGIGAWSLVDPVGLLAGVGVGATDARGLVELRAMYGGLELGLAAFLGWSAAGDPVRLRAGLLAASLTLGGLGAARVAAWAALRPEGWLLPALFVVELGFGLGAALAYRATSPDQAGSR